MKKAVDVCSKAGIGLIAMKTQALDYMGFLKKITPNEKEQALFNQLAKKQLTFEQAKLKAVWDDHRIASITTVMSNMTILQANVAAALNNKKNYHCVTSNFWINMHGKLLPIIVRAVHLFASRK